MQLEKQFRIMDFKELGDERGSLIVIEGGKDIPFEIKRAFYMYGAKKDVVRGRHANRNSSFVLINVSGTSKVRIDNGTEERVIELNRPKMGLFIKPMIWKDMYDFSEDSVLLVLSDEYYEEKEYIREYKEFLREVKGYSDQRI